MKILYVHERFGAFGGAEANILATATELKARGHIVGLLHGAHTGQKTEAWLNTFADRFAIAESRQAFRESPAFDVLQPDVLYVHKMSDLPTLECLSASGIPIVRMVHDHDLYCMRSYKYNCFTRQICERAFSPRCIFLCGASVAWDRESAFPLKWISYQDKARELELNRGFHRMIVASEFMQGELRRNGIAPERIEIHPPVPADDCETSRSSFSERNLIIYSGQIIRGKGVDVLLEALARVRLPFQCLIFGDGGHRAYCEKLSRKLGLAGRVTFKGYVPQAQISAFYPDCSVGAVSSVWPEPFGAVGLEAMRFGIPVVGFDAGGIREWLIDGYNGYLVPWMDRTAFAERLEDLLRDKLLARQMGERGRRFGAEQFQFGRYITRLEDLFARVAGKTEEVVVA